MSDPIRLCLVSETAAVVAYLVVDVLYGARLYSILRQRSRAPIHADTARP